MLPKSNLSTLKEALKQAYTFIGAYKPSKSIERLEIRIEPVDMLTWLALQSDDVKVYGANQSDTVSIAGIGQALCLTDIRHLGNFGKIFKQMRFYLSAKYPNLQWYGGFGFDERNQDEDWEEFGAYRFVIPRFELAAQGDKMIFCCNLVGRENTKSILKQLEKIVVPDHRFPVKASANELLRRSDQPDKGPWTEGVDQILYDRSVQKVVLARRTSLNFKQNLEPWAMLSQLKSVTPNSYHFAFQFKKSVFLGASPERLYRRNQQVVESEAIAGTVPRTADPGTLKNSRKDKHEHALVVEAINASFKEICSSFECDKNPSILTLPNGHHLITKFKGHLKDSVHDEDILKLLHPTPALGGTPREPAMDLIRKLEGFSRGWYGAPVGYVGLDWAEFVVGIRSGLARGKRLSVFAGAGIVEGSKADQEWDEVENKISNFIKIIQ